MLCTLSFSACGGGGGEEEGCAIEGTPTLEIGVPDSITFLDFEPLSPGGDIPLSSNGQTFLAVQLAVRAQNLGRFVHIAMTVTHDPGDGSVRTAVKTGEELERLFCRSDDRLYLIPVVVSSEDLGDDLEIQDQQVSIEITVTDEDDRTITQTASGSLRRI